MFYFLHIRKLKCHKDFGMILPYELGEPKHGSQL